MKRKNHMAKFIKFLPGPYQAPMPSETDKEGQMLRYLQTKYGDSNVDQFELMMELNDHQKDDSVIKDAKDRVRPLSQIFGFAVSDWVKNGYVERVTQKALAPATVGKVARMEAQIKALETILRDAGLPYTPFAWDAPKASETVAKAA